MPKWLLQSTQTDRPSVAVAAADHPLTASWSSPPTKCKIAFEGASVGDTITQTQVIDPTGTPSTVSTIWRNQTTGADSAGAPRH